MLLTLNTEEKCVMYFEQQRWGGNIICPHCNMPKYYRTATGFRCNNLGCFRGFTVTVKTALEGTHIKLQKWFMAIYLFSAHKKGISSHQLAKDIHVTQKTAWFMLHRIREMFKVKTQIKHTGKVQADETYVGGKTRNMHQWKQDIVNAAGTGAVHANAVFGMVSNGQVSAMPVSEVSQQSLTPIIVSSVEKGSTLITDGYGSYSRMSEHFRHEIVFHGDREYVRGEFHTNQIENFWSHLKRGIYGIYHHVSGKHLGRYCTEFAYRYNLRALTDCARFNEVLRGCAGRLKYSELIAK